MSSSTPVANADAIDASPTLVKKLIAETFGTFLLVFAVIGTAMNAALGAGILGVALSVATWRGARTLMVTQAAVQAATVLTVAAPGFEAGVDDVIPPLPAAK